LRERGGDGTQYGVELTYCVDRLPRGPAGCVHDAAMVTPADFYVVVEGSIIPGIDLAPVLRAQAKNGAALTIVVNDADEEEECFGSRMSPAGIYIFSPRACEVIPTTGYQDIKEMLVPQLRRKDGVVSAYFAAEPSPRINHLEWYLAAQGWILQKLGSGGPPSGGYRQLDGSYIHRRAYVADDACIVGPVMVGPNARVEQESVILGPSVIGNGSVIGDQSVVKHSVIWDHCSVGERAEVDRCLMISGASVPAGDVRFNKVCRPQVVGDGSQGTDHGRR
jgi:NDP-sugar pyrophosphorylase family protein